MCSVAGTLVINSNNLLVKNILKMNQSAVQADTVKLLCDHVYDTARMNNQPLTGESLQTFLTRSNQIMKVLSELS